MNEIKSSVITIIITTIVITLCELLFPKSEIKNQMRLITGTLLILSLISPFTQNFERIDFKFTGSTTTSNSIKNTERAVATALNYEIKNVLNENGINNGKVVIQTGVDNQSIFVECVYILFDETDKAYANKIVKVLKEELNIDVKVGDYDE